MRITTQSSLAALSIWCMAFILSGSCCGYGSVFAQDQEPAEARDSDAVETLQKKDQDAGADKSTTKPKQTAEKGGDKDQPQTPEEKAKPSLTDRFLEELNGKAQEQAENPLDAIVERMRAAQQRLLKTETDKETRELQTQIVKGLDELIEKLKNQPPPKSNQNQQPPPPMGDNDQNMPPRGSAQPKPQNSEKQGSGAEKQQPGAASNQSQGEKSRQSSNPAGQQRLSAEEEAARQRMAKDVWGHLPPALRQELLNVYSEKFLPKYDELVRKYYEALAEQNRKNP